MTSLILFGSLLIFIFLSVPIGLSLGLSAILAVSLSSSVSLTLVTQKFVTSLDSFPLMAIPFFMLAGLLMGRGGISKRILDLSNQLVGWMMGGLAMVTIVASSFFAALSGSGPATVGAIGSFMIPEMKEKNYNPGFASALTAASGVIGVIIPPSIPLILYGVISGVSISDLFKAGIIPGIFIAFTLMIYAYLHIRKDDNIEEEKVDVSFSSLVKAFFDAKWALLAPIIILGGIYAGIFTPTEAAAVAIVYSYVIGAFVYKELKWKETRAVLTETIVLIGATMFLLGTSISFSYLLTAEQIPKQIAEGILELTSNGIILLLLINLFLLIVGAFLDTVPAIAMLTPILLPIAIEAGVDPVHFGVILVVNLAIGFVTPPFGVNLFIASTIGRTRIEKIIVSMIPILFVLILALLVITYIAPLSMFLVNL